MYDTSFWSIVNPLNMWQQGDRWIAILFGFIWLIILGLIGAGLIALFGWLYHKFCWYRYRQVCQHEDCGNWTLDISSGQYPRCMAGQACCFDHTMDHKADMEPIYRCPIDREEMEKIIDGELIYDECPKCAHSLLSADELAALLASARASGKSSGFSWGLMMGTAING